MFDWLGDLISGIGDAIGGAFDYIGESIANTIFNSILQWLYEIIYGAISDFFEMIGNMGAEIFDLSWVQATVRLFTLFGWSLFAVGTVVAIFDVAIASQLYRETNAKGQIAARIAQKRVMLMNPQTEFNSVYFTDLVENVILEAPARVSLLTKTDVQISEGEPDHGCQENTEEDGDAD